MDFKPDHSIEGKELLKGKMSVIYAWRRGEEYLYVGSSLMGYSRFYAHDVIGKKEPVLESDVIDVWHLDNEAERLRLENLLIMSVKPKYNRYMPTVYSQGYKEKDVRKCLHCNKPIAQQVRKDKKYCTTKCQTNAWMAKHPRVKI